MKEYFLSQEFVILAGGLIIATVVYIVAARALPYLITGINRKLGIKETLTKELNGRIRRFLGFSYFVVLINILLHVPVVNEKARPVLDYALIETETLRLSFYSVAKGVIVFYLSLLITKIIRKLIQVYLSYKSKGEEIVSTVDILVYNSALLIIILASLSVMGISWKILLPVAGALGIGIGFGLHDIANNFISGFVILMGKTIKRGDWITQGENFGRIEEIGIRTSTLRTVDNIDIIIPNSQLITNQLINWSYTDNIVRIHIPVGVSYSSDVALVRETLLEVSKKASYVLDSPSPEARFLEFGNSSLNFELLVWMDIRTVKIPRLKSDLNYMIWDSFKEKGIQIPFPQRDVWFRNELKIDGPDGKRRPEIADSHFQSGHTEGGNI